MATEAETLESMSLTKGEWEEERELLSEASNLEFKELPPNEVKKLESKRDQHLETINVPTDAAGSIPKYTHRLAEEMPEIETLEKGKHTDEHTVIITSKEPFSDEQQRITEGKMKDEREGLREETQEATSSQHAECMVHSLNLTKVSDMDTEELKEVCKEEESTVNSLRTATIAPEEDSQKTSTKGGEAKESEVSLSSVSKEMVTEAIKQTEEIDKEKFGKQEMLHGSTTDVCITTETVSPEEQNEEGATESDDGAKKMIYTPMIGALNEDIPSENAGLDEGGRLSENSCMDSNEKKTETSIQDEVREKNEEPTDVCISTQTESPDCEKEDEGTVSGDSATKTIFNPMVGELIEDIGSENAGPDEGGKLSESSSMELNEKKADTLPEDEVQEKEQELTDVCISSPTEIPDTQNEEEVNTSDDGAKKMTLSTLIGAQREDISSEKAGSDEGANLSEDPSMELNEKKAETSIEHEFQEKEQELEDVCTSTQMESPDNQNQEEAIASDDGPKNMIFSTMTGAPTEVIGSENAGPQESGKRSENFSMELNKNKAESSIQDKVQEKEGRPKKIIFSPVISTLIEDVGSENAGPDEGGKLSENSRMELNEKKEMTSIEDEIQGKKQELTYVGISTQAKSPDYQNEKEENVSSDYAVFSPLISAQIDDICSENVEADRGAELSENSCTELNEKKVETSIEDEIVQEKLQEPTDVCLSTQTESPDNQNEEEENVSGNFVKKMTSSPSIGAQIEDIGSENARPDEDGKLSEKFSVELNEKKAGTSIEDEVQEKEQEFSFLPEKEVKENVERLFNASSGEIEETSSSQHAQPVPYFEERNPEQILKEEIMEKMIHVHHSNEKVCPEVKQNLSISDLNEKADIEEFEIPLESSKAPYLIHQQDEVHDNEPQDFPTKINKSGGALDDDVPMENSNELCTKEEADKETKTMGSSMEPTSELDDGDESSKMDNRTESITDIVIEKEENEGQNMGETEKNNEEHINKEHVLTGQSLESTGEETVSYCQEDKKEREAHEKCENETIKKTGDQDTEEKAEEHLKEDETDAVEPKQEVNNLEIEFMEQNVDVTCSVKDTKSVDVTDKENPNEDNNTEDYRKPSEETPPKETNEGLVNSSEPQVPQNETKDNFLQKAESSVTGVTEESSFKEVEEEDKMQSDSFDLSPGKRGLVNARPCETGLNDVSITAELAETSNLSKESNIQIAETTKNEAEEAGEIIESETPGGLHDASAKNKDEGEISSGEMVLSYISEQRPEESSGPLKERNLATTETNETTDGPRENVEVSYTDSTLDTETTRQQEAESMDQRDQGANMESIRMQKEEPKVRGSDLVSIENLEGECTSEEAETLITQAAEDLYQDPEPSAFTKAPNEEVTGFINITSSALELSKENIRVHKIKEDSCREKIEIAEDTEEVQPPDKSARGMDMVMTSEDNNVSIKQSYSTLQGEVIDGVNLKDSSGIVSQPSTTEHADVEETVAAENPEPNEFELEECKFSNAVSNTKEQDVHLICEADKRLTAETTDIDNDEEERNEVLEIISEPKYQDVEAVAEGDKILENVPEPVADIQSFEVFRKPDETKTKVATVEDKGEETIYEKLNEESETIDDDISSEKKTEREEVTKGSSVMSLDADHLEEDLEQHEAFGSASESIAVDQINETLPDPKKEIIDKISLITEEHHLEYPREIFSGKDMKHAQTEMNEANTSENKMSIRDDGIETVKDVIFTEKTEQEPMEVQKAEGSEDIKKQITEESCTSELQTTSASDETISERTCSTIPIENVEAIDLSADTKIEKLQAVEDLDCKSEATSTTKASEKDFKEDAQKLITSSVFEVSEEDIRENQYESGIYYELTDTPPVPLLDETSTEEVDRVKLEGNPSMVSQIVTNTVVEKENVTEEKPAANEVEDEDIKNSDAVYQSAAQDAEDVRETMESLIADGTETDTAEEEIVQVIESMPEAKYQHVEALIEVDSLPEKTLPSVNLTEQFEQQSSAVLPEEYYCGSTTITEKIEDGKRKKDEILVKESLEGSFSEVTKADMCVHDENLREVEVSKLELEPIGDEKNDSSGEAPKEESIPALKEAITLEPQENLWKADFTDCPSDGKNSMELPGCTQEPLEKDNSEETEGLLIVRSVVQEILPGEMVETSKETSNSEFQQSQQVGEILKSISEIESPKAIPETEDTEIKEEQLKAATIDFKDEESGIEAANKTIKDEISSEKLPRELERENAEVKTEEHATGDGIAVIGHNQDSVAEGKVDENVKEAPDEIELQGKKNETIFRETNAEAIVESEENLESVEHHEELMSTYEYMDEPLSEIHDSNKSLKGSKAEMLMEQDFLEGHKEMNEEVESKLEAENKKTQDGCETMEDVILNEEAVVDVQKIGKSENIKEHAFEEGSCTKELHLTSTSDEKASKMIESDLVPILNLETTASSKDTEEMELQGAEDLIWESGASCVTKPSEEDMKQQTTEAIHVVNSKFQGSEEMVKENNREREYASKETEILDNPDAKEIDVKKSIMLDADSVPEEQNIDDICASGEGITPDILEEELNEVPGIAPEPKYEGSKVDTEDIKVPNVTHIPKDLTEKLQEQCSEILPEEQDREITTRADKIEDESKIRETIQEPREEKTHAQEAKAVKPQENVSGEPSEEDILLPWKNKTQDSLIPPSVNTEMLLGEVGETCKEASILEFEKAENVLEPTAEVQNPEAVTQSEYTEIGGNNLKTSAIEWKDEEGKDEKIEEANGTTKNDISSEKDSLVESADEEKIRSNYNEDELKAPECHRETGQRLENAKNAIHTEELSEELKRAVPTEDIKEHTMAEDTPVIVTSKDSVGSSTADEILTQDTEERKDNEEAPLKTVIIEKTTEIDNIDANIEATSVTEEVNISEVAPAHHEEDQPDTIDKNTIVKNDTVQNLNIEGPKVANEAAEEATHEDVREYLRGIVQETLGACEAEKEVMMEDANSSESPMDDEKPKHIPAASTFEKSEIREGLSLKEQQISENPKGTSSPSEYLQRQMANSANENMKDEKQHIFMSSKQNADDVSIPEVVKCIQNEEEHVKDYEPGVLSTGEMTMMFDAAETHVTRTAAKENLEISQEVGAVDLNKVSEITRDVQELQEPLDCVSDKQNLCKPDPGESMKDIFSPCNKDPEGQVQTFVTEVEDLRNENASKAEPEHNGIEGDKKVMNSENKENKEKFAFKDPSNISLVDMLQESTKGTSEVAKNLVKESEPTQEKENKKPNTAEAYEVEGTKTDAEKEDEEGGDNEKVDSGSDAPVMVEASRDMDVKVHKKSHGILSGVGSKVKHSISKVKKAITGKHSHPKPSSPQ